MLKAQHQRDLESYKVSLIAKTEKHNALQPLQTAALKILEKKDTAIEHLHAALDGYASSSLLLLDYFNLVTRAASIKGLLQLKRNIVLQLLKWKFLWLSRNTKHC